MPQSVAGSLHLMPLMEAWEKGGIMPSLGPLLVRSPQLALQHSLVFQVFARAWVVPILAHNKAENGA